MLPYPSQILDYLYAVVIAQRSPAYLCITKDGTVVEAGGQLAYYRMSSVAKGQYVMDRLCFLQGLLPIADQPVVVPLIQIQDEHFVDLHLIHGEQGDWVLLLDSTAEAHRLRQIQQMVYDLKLLQESQ